MTGSTTQATIDAVDLMVGIDRITRRRSAPASAGCRSGIFYFAAGCALSATLLAGRLWNLGLAVLVGAAAAMLRLEAEV